jgi:hypothetical protein
MKSRLGEGGFMEQLDPEMPVEFCIDYTTFYMPLGAALALAKTFYDLDGTIYRKETRYGKNGEPNVDYLNPMDPNRVSIKFTSPAKYLAMKGLGEELNN